jgi:glucan phosphoethanolaminetransferase (alkaline phosphatase superfamily)
MRNKSKRYKLLYFSMLTCLLLNFITALIIWVRVEFYNQNLEGLWWVIFFSGLAVVLGGILSKEDKK